MRPIFGGTVAASLALLLSGCYHHRLLTYGQTGNVSTFQRTVNTGWAGHGGTVVPPAGAPATQSCNNPIDRNGMHMVVINSNLGYSVLAVVTLGALSPAKVQWNCAPNPSVVGPTPSGRVATPAAAATSPAAAGFTVRTPTSIVWGLLQGDAKAPDNPLPSGTQPPGPPTPANCNDGGMRQVKIGMSPLNYIYSLATVATVGFVSPLQVAWQCEDTHATH